MTINIDDLTIKQAKELVALFQVSQGVKSSLQTTGPGSLNSMVGSKVIIRTYSAGNWFGELSEKSGNEVILINARRLYIWNTISGMSLSEIANNGLDQEKSKICEPVNSVWLEAIEIIPCSIKSIKSIEGAENTKTL